MTTAVDTNVFSRIWFGGQDAGRAEVALRGCSADGLLIISPIVYAEMLANPGVSENQALDFLAQTGIRTDYSMLSAVWAEAGRRFGAYARRKRMSGGGESRRLIADFVVGAHALVQAERLLTFDMRRYRTDFPDLRLIDVSS